MKRKLCVWIRRPGGGEEGPNAHGNQSRVLNDTKLPAGLLIFGNKS